MAILGKSTRLGDIERKTNFENKWLGFHSTYNMLSDCVVLSTFSWHSQYILVSCFCSPERFAQHLSCCSCLCMWERVYFYMFYYHCDIQHIDICQYKAEEDASAYISLFDSVLGNSVVLANSELRWSLYQS